MPRNQSGAAETRLIRLTNIIEHEMPPLIRCIYSLICYPNPSKENKVINLVISPPPFPNLPLRPLAAAAVLPTFSSASPRAQPANMISPEKAGKIWICWRNLNKLTNESNEHLTCVWFLALIQEILLVLYASFTHPQTGQPCRTVISYNFTQFSYIVSRITFQFPRMCPCHSMSYPWSYITWWSWLVAVHPPRKPKYIEKDTYWNRF